MRIENAKLNARLTAIEKAVEPFVAELPEIDAWQLRNASKLIMHKVTNGDLRNLVAAVKGENS